MLSYFGRRVLVAIPTLIGIVAVVFFAVRLIPGDPALNLASDNATEADIAAIRQKLGLDQPIIVQFVIYVGQVFTGEFGASIMSGAPVLEEITHRMPVTLTLALAASAIGVVVGVSMGLLAARKPGGVVDGIVSSIAISGLSIPVFWLGLVLVLLFSVTLQLLPSGYDSSAASFVLPVMAMSFFPVGLIARVTRSSLSSVLSQDYVRTARAKGASAGRIVVAHALRNASVSIITVAGMLLGALLGGAVMTETVFSMPGLGRLLVTSILNRDYPVLQGVVIVLASMYLFVTLLVDVTYGLIDPRVRND